MTLAGIAELLIAVGLQVPDRWPCRLLCLRRLMLACIFPANIKAAREKLTIAGRASAWSSV